VQDRVEAHGREVVDRPAQAIQIAAQELDLVLTGPESLLLEQ
jgi:hypothetical protein